MDRGPVGTEGNEDSDETQRLQDCGTTDDRILISGLCSVASDLRLKKNVTSAKFRH
jgi:hypothetical protein